jgi:hypothetical protein
MASKFGGIPVEENEAAKPAGSRFGGVPVEEEIPLGKPPVLKQEQNPQSKGFLGELWDEVKNGPANLAKVGDAINNAVLHPYETAKAMGQPMLETAGKARDAWKSGDYKKAVREGLNTGINAVLPGVGSASSEAGDMYDRGDIAGGTGKTLGIGANLAIGAKAPQIVKSTGTAVAETITPGVKGPIGRATTADPRVAVNRSLRPVPTDPNFPKRVPETLKAIKESNAGEAPAGITDGQLDMVGATNRAIAETQGALDQWLTRAKGVRVNGDELVAATREAIPQMMWERDPAGARALVQDAQRAFGGKTYTVEQFRDFLKSENADLSAFYRKAPGVQADASVAGTPAAIQEAQTGRIREVLYKALDPEGGGAGPRTIQQKTGDLIHMRDAALRRNNAIVAEQPLTPIDRILDPIKAHLPQIMTPKAAATGLSFSEGQVGRSLPLLKKAFKAVGDDPANALPLPGEPLYPTGNTARQITAGDIITPPPADTSFVRGAQGMNQPPNPARALPPATTRFTPTPGAQGPHPATSPGGLGPTQGPTMDARSPVAPAGPSGVMDLIAVEDPLTGQIRYVPGPRRFAKGGWAGLHGEEKIIVGDGGEPELILPLSHIRKMGPQAQKHLLKGIGSHLGIGKPRRNTTLGHELGGRSRPQEKK